MIVNKNKNGKAEVDWNEYAAFHNWRMGKLSDLINPIQEVLKLYMPNKSVQINKDCWEIIEEN